MAVHKLRNGTRPPRWLADSTAVAIVIQRTLDLQGQTSTSAVECAARAMPELVPGELIELLTTDPCSVKRFAAWCRTTGNALLESSQFGNVFRFVIRKT